MFTDLSDHVFTDLFSHVFTDLFSHVFTDLFSHVFTDLSSHVFTDLSSHVFTDLSSHVFTDLSSHMFTDLSSHVFTDLSSHVFTDLSSHVFTDLYSHVFTDLSSICSLPSVALFLCTVHIVSTHLFRPALLEHMPLIETHHHTLDNGVGEDGDLLNGSTSLLSITNSHNIQQSAKRPVSVSYNSSLYGRPPPYLTDHHPTWPTTTLPGRPPPPYPQCHLSSCALRVTWLFFC